MMAHYNTGSGRKATQHYRRKGLQEGQNIWRYTVLIANMVFMMGQDE